MFEEHRHGLLFWLVKWALIVLVSTLIVDCLFVMWPYPAGVAIGLPQFESQVHDEWTMLVAMSDSRYPGIAYAIYDTLHTAFFKWPGFDYMITRALDPTPLEGGDEFMRKAVLGTRTFWGTALAGLQLFSARLAVLVVCLPLVVLAAIGAVADGLVTWYRRRTGGGRESGFIFHRAKRHAGHALLALCLIYLIPPFATDPRWVITVFVAIYTISIRVAVSRFKKFI